MPRTKGKTNQIVFVIPALTSPGPRQTQEGSQKLKDQLTWQRMRDLASYEVEGQDLPWTRLALSSACSGVGLELELLLLPPPQWCDHRALSPQLAKKSDPHRENPERSMGLRWRRS